MEDDLKNENDPKNEDDLKNECNLKNEDSLKNHDDFKNEDYLKNEDNLKNKNDLKNEDDLKIGDTLSNEDDLKNKDIKNEDDRKMKTTLKIPPPFQILFCPLPSSKKLPEIFFDDFSNREWNQASKPEMEFHIINIIYAALSLHAQTEKRHFHAKTTDHWRSTHVAGYSARDSEISLCHIPLLRSFIFCNQLCKTKKVLYIKFQ